MCESKPGWTRRRDQGDFFNSLFSSHQLEYSVTRHVAQLLGAAMASVTFDTFKLVDRLKAAGFADDQAATIVRIISESQEELLTKQDLQLELAPLKSDLAVLKWMTGLMLAGVLSLILTSFF
ncbi:MAG: hypothetical protein VBE63_25925 [Lamprobacter sp.]|uniref:hypothetical protein n=1 Tax=Lamprobacter sp. TaxID=3100796 RepID=UPI002B25FD11|nr:hypothetical protein [Lamprobacter sp.]MEA3643347.1 hypothetical protein [Lamprobacter sp.]